MFAMAQQQRSDGKRGTGLVIGCAILVGGGVAIVGAGFAMERANGREVQTFCNGIQDGEPVASVAARAVSSRLRAGPISASKGMLIIINSSFTRCLVDHDGQHVVGHKLFYSG